MKEFKRSIGISIATLMMITGAIILYTGPESEKEQIIYVDKKTEIRIVEGVKYRCTVIDNK